MNIQSKPFIAYLDYINSLDEFGSLNMNPNALYLFDSQYSEVFINKLREQVNTYKICDGQYKYFKPFTHSQISKEFSEFIKTTIKDLLENYNFIYVSLIPGSLNTNKEWELFLIHKIKYLFDLAFIRLWKDLSSDIKYIFAKATALEIGAHDLNSQLDDFKSMGF